MKKNKIPQGYVLIRLTDKPDQLDLGNGTTLYLDTSYNPNDHAPVTGIVEIVPEQLCVRFDNMEWDTDIEIKVGDKVQVTAMESMNCLGHEYDSYGEYYGDDRFIRDGDDYLIFAHYSTIILCNDEPVNGFCIVEPIEEKHELEIETSNKLAVGKVIKTGSINRYYVEPTGGHGFVNQVRESDNVSPGDIIIYRRFADIKLEKTDYWRIQRKHMLAIYPDKPLNENVIMKKVDRQEDELGSLLLATEVVKYKYSTYEVVAGFDTKYVICKTGVPVDYDVDGVTYSVVSNRNVLLGINELKFGL